MTEGQQVATTILQQIKAADFWCLARCGYRQPQAESPNGTHCGQLTFRVTITSNSTKHYITVALMPNDTYTVERIKIKRGTYERIVEGSHDNVYCDQLVDIIDSLTQNR